MAENGTLSKDGRIPWDLPDEVAHFRRECAGHWILVGRKTWEQMSGWFQPDHTAVVLSTRPLHVPGGYVVSSISHARTLAEVHGAARLMVIGGAQVFTSALPYADFLILTTVHATISGDTSFPSFASDEWVVTQSKHHAIDDHHTHPYSIQWLARRISTTHPLTTLIA